MFHAKLVKSSRTLLEADWAFFEARRFRNQASPNQNDRVLDYTMHLRRLKYLQFKQIWYDFPCFNSSVQISEQTACIFYFLAKK